VQIHDFNPGVAQSGLFWTTMVPASSVAVDLDAGTATLQVANLPQFDFIDFPNAVLRNGPRPRPGTVSFTVRWTAAGDTFHVDNPDQQLRGDFRAATAQMEWTARTPEFEFTSDELATSTSDSAQLGSESNGSFY